MSRLQEFYAARAQNLERRSKLAAWADWAEAPPKPKQFWFNRETYLVPEWPMPAAPSPDGQSFALLDNREVAIRTGNGDVHKLTSGAKLWSSTCVSSRGPKRRGADAICGPP